MFEDIKQEERLNTYKSSLISIDPIILRQFPSKERRKYILLQLIITKFESGKLYKENEINAILRPMYEDFVALRRALIDYKFLSRAKDGSTYEVSTTL